VPSPPTARGKGITDIGVGAAVPGQRRAERRGMRTKSLDQTGQHCRPCASRLRGCGRRGRTGQHRLDLPDRVAPANLAELIGGSRDLHSARGKPLRCQTKAIVDHERDGKTRHLLRAAE
jgi:hypothetical protein